MFFCPYVEISACKPLQRLIASSFRVLLYWFLTGATAGKKRRMSSNNPFLLSSEVTYAGGKLFNNAVHLDRPAQMPASLPSRDRRAGDLYQFVQGIFMSTCRAQAYPDSFITTRRYEFSARCFYTWPDPCRSCFFALLSISSRAAAKDHRSKGINLTSALGAAYLAPDLEGSGGQVLNPETYLRRVQPVQEELPPRKRNPTEFFAHSEHMQTGRKRGPQSPCASLQLLMHVELVLASFIKV
jgi:hypothetical protein